MVVLSIILSLLVIVLLVIDIRLRKWCAELTKDWGNSGNEDGLRITQSLYDWVNGRYMPDQMNIRHIIDADE